MIPRESIIYYEILFELLYQNKKNNKQNIPYRSIEEMFRRFKPEMLERKIEMLIRYGFCTMNDNGEISVIENKITAYATEYEAWERKNAEYRQSNNPQPSHKSNFFRFFYCTYARTEFP